VNDRLLSIDEVAEYLSVHRDTVYNLVRSGRLPALQLGGRKASWRVTREDLEEFVRTAKNGGSAAVQQDEQAVDEFDRNQAESLERFRADQEAERRSFLTQRKRPHQDR
jgi:excisionase family DNA binding protein